MPRAKSEARGGLPLRGRPPWSHLSPSQLREVGGAPSCRPSRRPASLACAAVFATVLAMRSHPAEASGVQDACAAPPNLGPMFDVSSCAADAALCSTCVAECSCGAGACVGESVALRCLGEDDATGIQGGACDGQGLSGMPHWFTESACGAGPCCPTMREAPSGCEDRLDVDFGLPGQCQALLQSGYSCNHYFCPGCGVLAGKCDRACDFGPCRHCGDCWLDATGPDDQCDDGNNEDGDGCSSSCDVEPGWICERKEFSGDQGSAFVDACTTCVDHADWADAQGMTCADYQALGACDTNASPDDPVVLGGRLLSTPTYHRYSFAYDIDVKDGTALSLVFGVKAASDAHIFIGKPKEYGFEVVIGGWNNGLSILRSYPSGTTYDNYYGGVLDPGSVRYFWIHYKNDGDITVGLGDVVFNHTLLRGQDLTIAEHFGYGWGPLGETGNTALKEVWAATGWGSAGEFHFRVKSGSTAPTLRSLATGGLSAADACCACGGGVADKPCNQKVPAPAPPAVTCGVKGTDYSRLGRRLGRGGSAARIVNGQDAFYCEWRWQACLIPPGYGSTSCSCGGTLIATQWVLTAAHCVVFDGVQISPTSLTVIMGDYNHQDHDDSSEVASATSEIFVHPSYDENNYRDNDIALLKLASPVPLGDCIGTACLPDGDVAPGTKCYATGWGRLAFGEGSQPITLQETLLTVVSNAECQKTYPPEAISDSMVCADGSAIDGRPTGHCQGDSGGPLVSEGEGGIWTVVGVVSWGYGCASGSPGVYARVHYFKDWIDRTMSEDAAGAGRRLVGPVAFFNGDPVIIGSVTPDGFTLRIRFTGCLTTSQCKLTVVVLAHMTAGNLPAAYEGSLALMDIWPRKRFSGCVLFEEPQVAPPDYDVEKQPLHERFWEATGCQLSLGSSYLVALHMDSIGGSNNNDVASSLTFSVPTLPRSSPVSAAIRDHDMRPGFASGEVLLHGAKDESDILQYRLYWGQGWRKKVSNIKDSNEGLAGVANLFAGGGLRNGNDNECIFSDCDWQFHKVKSSGEHAIRHAITGECLCYRGAALGKESCMSELQSLDQPVQYHYVNLGEGTLISNVEHTYLYAQYRELGETLAEVQSVIETACSADEACVGYHVNTAEDKGLYLEAAMLWDAEIYRAREGTAWPPLIPSVFSNAGGSLASDNPYNVDKVGVHGTGSGKPQAAKTSVNAGLGWYNYQAFIKELQAPACMWSIETRHINGTNGLVESRLVNSRYKQCLCQVPVFGAATEDGGQEGDPAGAAGRQQLLGPWCDQAEFPFQVGDSMARTARYCEWTAKSLDPTRAASASSRPLQLDAGEALTQASLSGGASLIDDWHGAPAWNLTGDAQLLLNSPLSLAGSYTLAAWVDLHGSSAGDGSSHELFSGSEADQACMQVAQMTYLDGRPPQCSSSVCDEHGELEHCCSWPVNSGVGSAEVTCNCTCPTDAGAEDVAEFGSPLPGDRWALGLRTCGSAASWDAGAQLKLPEGVSTGWTLMVAVGHQDHRTDFYMSGPEVVDAVTYVSEFDCSIPSCTATAVLRDISREEWRSCALTVSVYMNDFDRSPTEPDPEVVEAIVVRGGFPEETRVIKRNCHPDTAGEFESLYDCIKEYNLDSFTHSVTSSRALRVDVNVSAAVDSPHPDGSILKGVVTVVCKKLTMEDKYTPPSGSIRKVGAAAQTCASSSLQAVGVSKGSSEMYLGQAWVWDHALSPAQVDALYWSTRTRYYKDYKVLLRSQSVTQSGPEMQLDAELECRQPGCEASAHIEGLPSSQSATCHLNVWVAITDFSRPEEVVEYIRLDGIDVVKDCWPKAEDLAGMGVGHYCALNLDVSQAALDSAYLADGAAEVAIKISESVDAFATEDRNPAYLAAFVRFRCSVVDDIDLPQGAVALPVDVTNVVAVSSNEQGEGPLLEVPFVDVVMGFEERPAILEVQSRSVWMSVSVSDEEACFIWVFLTDPETARYITKQEIKSEQGIGEKDICPGSHRRRGSQQWSKFALEPYLLECPMEPHVPYSLLVYVDRYYPEPYGTGTLEVLDFVGVDPYPEVNTPQQRARAVYFEDTDSTPGKIVGTMIIVSAWTEIDITGYRIYWGFNGKKTQYYPDAIKEVVATGLDRYEVALDYDIPQENEVTDLLVYAHNSLGDGVVWRVYTIEDATLFLNVLPHIMSVSKDGDNYAFEVVLESNYGKEVRVDIGIVPAWAVYMAEPYSHQKGLNTDILKHYMLCWKLNYRQFTTSSSGQFRLEIGTDSASKKCALTPREQYAFVVFVSIQETCPCQEPCLCRGSLTSAVTVEPGGFLLSSPDGLVILSDQSPPQFALECGGACATDTTLSPRIELEDVHQSYPAFVVCAACRPGSANLPKACLRPGDDTPHRYWRIRLDDCSATGSTRVAVVELEFFALSPLDADGEGVTPHLPMTDANGGSLAAQDAFDNDTDTYLDVRTERGYHWVGLDLGASNEAAVLRARVTWRQGWCIPAKTHLEWSDDGAAWSSRGTSLGSTAVGSALPVQHVFLSVQHADWNHGALYQGALDSEGELQVTVGGLTPGSDYCLHCYARDGAGNADTSTCTAGKTTDTTGPMLMVKDFEATDFETKGKVHLRDPGLGYPALSTCVARKKSEAQSMPLPSQGKASGQRCHTIKIPAARVDDGRVDYVELFQPRFGDEVAEVRFSQNSWGGGRKELGSCGLRHEQMPAGQGQCGAKGGRRQRLDMIFNIGAKRDAWIFVGEQGVGGIGYEIIIGGWSNTMSALKRGVASDPKNAHLEQWSLIMVTDKRPIALLGQPGSYRIFWISLDPDSGYVRVGRGDGVGLQTFIEYQDPDPISNFDTVMVGAGYEAADGEGRGQITVIACPNYANLARNKPVYSSSVSFGGIASKVNDGQTGDGHFCHYCVQEDPHHVCMMTQRENQTSAPHVVVDLGYGSDGGVYQVGYVRLVGPAIGDLLPEQSKKLSIHIGGYGNQEDWRCKILQDARGDNLIDCGQNAYGRYVSVWADPDALATMPAPFGMAICELEVYGYLGYVNTLDAAEYRLENGAELLQQSLAPGEWESVSIRALEPNTTYEVFCYGEDANNYGAISNVVEVQTSDHTPPVLDIVGLHASDQTIDVSVHLRDPGSAYPAEARCGVTTGGRTPRDHERFFMHRYWRMRFKSPAAGRDPVKLDLAAASQAHSNLGGLGPNSQSPQSLKFNGVGINYMGARVDLEITAEGVYMASDPGLNSKQDSVTGRVNVAACTSVDLIFTFVDGNSGAPVTVGTFDVRFLDLDTDAGSNVQDKLTIHKGYSKFMVAENARYITTPTRGGGMAFLADSGEAADGDAAAQMRREVGVTYVGTSSFRITWAAPATTCVGAAGRDLLFTFQRSPSSSSLPRPGCGGSLLLEASRFYALDGSKLNAQDVWTSEVEACPATCGGQTCDELAYSCDYLEQQNGCDCSGCTCGQFGGFSTAEIAADAPHPGYHNIIGVRFSLLSALPSSTGAMVLVWMPPGFVPRPGCGEWSVRYSGSFFSGTSLLLPSGTTCTSMHDHGKHYAQLMLPGTLQTSVMYAFQIEVDNPTLTPPPQDNHWQIETRSGVDLVHQASHIEGFTLFIPDCEEIQTLATVNASCDSSCQSPALNALDGEASTAWTPHGTDTSAGERWIELLWPSEVCISKVRARTSQDGRYTSSHNFTILDEFVGMQTVTLSDRDWLEQEFFELLTTRLRISTAPTDGWFGWYDIEVCKCRTETAVPTPAPTPPPTPLRAPPDKASSVFRSWDAWVAVDFLAMSAPEQAAWELRARSGAAAGAIRGDLVVHMLSDFNMSLLELQVITPSGANLRSGSMAGGTVDNVPGTSVKTAAFAVAPAGEYTVRVRWQGDAGDVANLDFLVRACGTMSRKATTVTGGGSSRTQVIGKYSVLDAGCSREDPSESGSHKAWQSTLLPERPAPETTAVLSDRDFSSCVETGGLGRPVEDSGPWLKVDLGKVVQVEAVWVAGNREPPLPEGVDRIWTGPIDTRTPLPGAATLTSTTTLTTGTTTSTLYSAQAVDIYLSNTTQGARVLCASGVPVGRVIDQEPSLAEPPLAAACVSQQGRRAMLGRYVWVMSASPASSALALCEMEIITAPLPILGQALLHWGQTQDGYGTVCGAGGVEVEWSDDNVSWYHMWETGLLSQSGEPQKAEWSWADRLFDMPFSATFAGPGTEVVSIPSLKENSTYDVYCWAKDSIGNDLSDELVLLISGLDLTDTLPIADSRRLTGDSSGEFQCTSEVRQYISCEEDVLTSDHLAPSVVSGSATDLFLMLSPVGIFYEVTWEVQYLDVSCDHVSAAAQCIVTCLALPQDPQSQEPTSCRWENCDESEPWTNGVPTVLVFNRLRADEDYIIRCTVSDPWGNILQHDTSYRTPEPPPTHQPTSRPTPPPTMATAVPTPAPTNPTPAPTWYFQGLTLPPNAVPAPPPSGATTLSSPATPAPTPAPPTPAPTPVGPQVVRIILSLGTTTRADAEVFYQADATAAVRAALRSHLGLAEDDSCETTKVQLRALQRRLADAVDDDAAEGSPARRAQAVWEVLVSATVTIEDPERSPLIMNRIGALDVGLNSARLTLQAEVRDSLAAASLEVEPSVLDAEYEVGATPAPAPLPPTREPLRLPDGQGSAPAPPPPASTPADHRGAHDGPAAADEASEHGAWLLPLLGVVSALLIVVPVGAVCAYCLWVRSHAATGPKDRAAIRQSPGKKVDEMRDASGAVRDPRTGKLKHPPPPQAWAPETHWAVPAKPTWRQAAAQQPQFVTSSGLRFTTDAASTASPADSRMATPEDDVKSWESISNCQPSNGVPEELPAQAAPASRSALRQLRGHAHQQPSAPGGLG